MTAPKRRWRSMEEAYQAGQAVGFMQACDLLRILRDPDEFLERVQVLSGAFSELVREAQRGRGPGEIRETE